MYLNNQLLVAMPGMQDSRFAHSVAFVCEHNEKGALGIIINKPIDVKLAEVLSHMKIDEVQAEPATRIVFKGGPVETQRGFVLHRGDEGEWDACLDIDSPMQVTTSRDILESIAHGEGPADYLVALGYAGWGAGQLDQELLENAWLNVPVEESLIFQTPVADRWHRAAELLGVDIDSMGTASGHA